MRTDSKKWCSDPDAYFQIDEASRIPILHSAIARELLKRRPSRILDYGSGDGRFLTSLPAVEELQITLFDPDRNALKLAKKSWAGRPGIHFETKPESLPSESFDAVVCCNVLMVLKNVNEFNAVIANLKTTVRKGGFVYVGITHPCFVDRTFATYSNDYTKGSKAFNYFANGDAYNVYMQGVEKQIVIKDFFWNLSSVINRFIREGLCLLKLRELRDVSKNNYSPFLLLIFN